MLRGLDLRMAEQFADHRQRHAAWAITVAANFLISVFRRFVFWFRGPSGSNVVRNLVQ